MTSTASLLLGAALLLAGKESVVQTLAEIREGLPAGASSEVERPLRIELHFPSPEDSRTLATVHGVDDLWSIDRLAIWAREGEGYRLVEAVEEGHASAATFRYADRRFLLLVRSMPAAGHAWDGVRVAYPAEDGSLQPVILRKSGPCSPYLPDIGTRFEDSYGGWYSFEDDAIEFEWMIWKDGDPPNFPSGGAVVGTLEITGEGPFELRVQSCKKLSMQELDESE